MALETWLTYFITSLILTATPGPSIFLGIVHSVNYGARRTAYTALGDISANFLQMMLVAAGLSVVLAHSEAAFHAIKWFGVTTLIYMGAKMLLFSRNRAMQNLHSTEISNRKLFFSGFMVAAGNPKAIVFFSAFFPQFIDPNSPLLPQLAVMCPTMSLLDFSMVMLYALFAERLVLSGKAKFVLIRRASGAMLIWAAGMLAVSTR